MANLGDLQISNETIEINGCEYVVTTGTGEVNYGSEFGGSAAFAYYADEVESEPQPHDYSDFCERVSAVRADDPNWLALAVALACRGQRLTIAGVCTPALTGREYQIARIAHEMAR